MLTNGKTVALIGFGESNRALCDYLIEQGVYPVIRNKELVKVPSGCRLVTDNYLEVREDIAFRSPVIRPDRIKNARVISSEADFALSLTNGTKIGVTGSDGKTTTSTLIARMLECAGKDVRLCGNIGTPIIKYLPTSSHGSYTVCELSSFQLFDASLSLDTAVITNISENHLDWHTDLNEYIESKSRILENSKRAVLSYDDFRVRALAKDTQETFFFSVKDTKAPKGAHLVCVKDGAILCDGVKITDIDKIRLKGKFNILNIESAIGALFGVVPVDAMAQVASEFSGVEGRMEYVCTKNGISFVCSSIDSTPARTIATLSAFDKSKCVVILGGYDKNLSYLPLAEALCGIKHAVICGANAEKIYESIKGSCRAHITVDFAPAVRDAYSKCDRGDTVLLSPASASFDMFDNYKERAKKFKEIVRGLK